MAPEKTQLRTAYNAEKTLQPFYTGGKVALDETGRILFTTLNDEVIVTDFETGDELARIEGDEELITTFAITPNASHVAVCSRSQTMRIYSLSPTSNPLSVTPKLLRSTRAHDAPIIVSTIDPTGTFLATGGAEGLVKVWDLRGGFVTHNFRGHGGVVSALCFYAPQDADKWRLATGADDCTIRIWDLKSRKCISTMEGHVSVVRGLDWSEDGSILASGSRDKVVMLWDTRKWTVRNTIPVLEEVETVGFIKTGEGEQSQVLYTGGQKNRVRLWDVNKGEELTEEVSAREEKEELGISDIIYLPSVPSLLSVHNDQTLVLYSLPANRTSNGLTLPILKTLSGHLDEIIDLAFVSPERTHLALASNSETVRIIDPQTFGDVGLLQGHTEIVLTIDVDSTGNWLASSGKDNDARLWKLDIENKKFKCVSTCTGHAESVGACALSRALRSDPSTPPPFLVTGSQDRTIKLWDLSKGKAKALYTRRAHEKDINAIDVSPDDNMFASASQDRTVKIWDRASGETVGVLRGHKRGVWTVKFAPNTVNAAILGSESGKLIATGSGDKTIKLWSLATFSCLRTFEGHSNSILKLLWVTSGNQLVSSAGDGLVKLWDLKKGECSLTMDNHTDRVWALAGRNDGAEIASGAADSTITIWKDKTVETALQEAEEMQLRVRQEQQLDNLVAVQDYRSAISLALSLDRPGQLLNIFKEALMGDKATAEARAATESAISEVILELSDEQLVLLLSRVRDWNTSAKTADISQKILHLVLQNHDLFHLSQRVSRASKPAARKSKDADEEEEEEDDSDRKIRKGVLGKGGMMGLVKALEVYSEKHYERLEGVWEDSWCLEYTLERMGMVLDS